MKLQQKLKQRSGEFQGSGNDSRKKKQKYYSQWI